MNIDDKSKFGELFEESIKESNSSLNHIVEEKRNIERKADDNDPFSGLAFIPLSFINLKRGSRADILYLLM